MSGRAILGTVLGISAVAGLIALGFYLKNQAKLLMNYCYKITRYKLVELNKKRVAMTVDLMIKNKSDLDVLIDGYKFDIFLNGHKITTIGNKVQQALKANSFGTISVYIDVAFKDPVQVLEDWDFLSGILFDHSKIKISFRGYVSANVAGLKIQHLPVTIESTLSELMSGDSGSNEPCV